MFYVYCIINEVNYKMYIGKATECQKQPQKRWSTHKTVAKGGKKKYPAHFQYLHQAIVKYGPENFTFIKMEYHSNESNAFAGEKFWIQYLETNQRDIGYNQTTGGEGTSGRICKPETKLRISQSHKKGYQEGRISATKGREPWCKGKKLGPHPCRIQLTPEQLSIVAQADRSTKDIAKEFGVSQSIVSRARQEMGIVSPGNWGRKASPETLEKQRRQRSGASGASAKLTWTNIIAIRQLLLEGKKQPPNWGTISNRSNCHF